MDATGIFLVAGDGEQKAVGFAAGFHPNGNVQTFGQFPLVDAERQVNGAGVEHQIHRQQTLSSSQEKKEMKVFEILSRFIPTFLGACQSSALPFRK